LSKKENKTKEISYAEFHFANLGFEFEEKYSKKRYSKLDIFYRVQNNELNILTENKHNLYIKVNRKGYNSKGEYIYCETTGCKRKNECYRYNYREKQNTTVMKFLNSNHCEFYDFDFTLNRIN